MTKARVVIAEDHLLFRDALQLMLTSKFGLDVVGTAGDGLEAIRLVGKENPDLLLIDLSMPNLGGIDAIKEIRKNAPEIRIIVVSMHCTEKYLRAAMSAGANGYVLKMADQKEFHLAVDVVLAGKSYVSSEFTNSVMNRFLDDESAPESSLELLTQREREILKLLAEGNSNKEAAALLYISPKTVDNHRTNIMKKLDVHNIIELSNFAREHGLLVDS